MFRLKLMLVSLLFLLLVGFLGGLSHWVASESRYQLERSRLAHTVHAEYLKLAAQTYALFKQLIDTWISDAQGNGPDVIETRQHVEATLDRIRTLIASEVALTSASGREAEEKEELLLLAEIERQINKILSEFVQASRFNRSGWLDHADLQIVKTLEESIDRNFRLHLEEALRQETEEVAEADRYAAALARQLQYLVYLSVATALLLGTGAVFALVRRLRGPLSALLRGTEALAAGDLSHRISVSGRDEFARLAASFNHMAQELEHQQQCLKVARTSLEQTVDETTHELQLANEALQRTDLTRRQFFADISHELRTPLTLIRGEAQIALRGADKPNADYKEALGRILEQAQHLSRLVDDLLFIARADAGAARLQQDAVALDQLVEHICNDAQTLGNRKDIRIDFRSETAGAVIVGDHGRLRQLFLILLENAIHYSPPGGRVTVTLSPGPQGVVTHVSDCGIGIAPEELDRVFERFYRGKRAAEMNAEGSGLGLPVAKAIVEAHGGSISIASSTDAGTTVAVTLPAERRLSAVA